MRAVDVDAFIAHQNVLFALLEDHGRALGDLFGAGLAIIGEPDAPRWFHAQRVIVALARSRLAQFDPTRRAAARRHEARTLLRLRDFANRRARSFPATTRKAKRRRRRLEALAREWQQQADLLLHGEAN